MPEHSSSIARMVALPPGSILKQRPNAGVHADSGRVPYYSTVPLALMDERKLHAGAQFLLRVHGGVTHKQTVCMENDCLRLGCDNIIYGASGVSCEQHNSPAHMHVFLTFIC